MKDIEGKRLEKSEPKLIDARTLIQQMTAAGPAPGLRVRIFSKSDGKLFAVGETRWRDDRISGPSIVFPSPENKNQEWIIALGGDTYFDLPPRVSSNMSARAMAPTFGKVEAHTRDIDPMTEGYLFEIIKK
jgi:hypothetical protein